MNLAVETFGLTKYYPSPQGFSGLIRRQRPAIMALDHVNLQVKRGELFGLVGPNGAGKTTLIKSLSTLILPTEGNALVNGHDLSQDTEIKASIGLVTSDERSFYWRLTGRQNLEFFASLHYLPSQEINHRIVEAIEIVRLQEVIDRRFMTYSTGMRQRLSIARALLSKPELLFLDEPTKGLDPIGIQALHNLIRDELTSRQGITILLTSHWLEEIEQLCDRIAIMDRGQIRACGTMSELRQAIGLGEKYHLLVGGLPDSISLNLQEFVSNLQVSTLDADRTQIEFDLFNQSSQLNQVLEVIRSRGGQIWDLKTQPVNLETIFSRLTHYPQESDDRHDPIIRLEDQKKTSPSRPQVPGTKPTYAMSQRFSDQVRIAWAFIQRDVREEVSYRLSFALQFLNIFFSVGLFYFISKLLGNSAAPYLEPYGGDYFAFVLIGIAFSGYFGVGLSSFSSSLRQAQTTGTLEAMLTTPTSLSTIILSSSLWSYLLTTLRVIVYLLIGGLFLGVNLTSGNYSGAFLVLVLTIITFSSLGILAASFIMVIKRGDPITWLFNATSSFLGGVYYPITILPGWMQFFAYLIPVTYALRAMRLTLLQGSSLETILPDLLALILFSVVLLPVSLFAFRYAVQRAREDGSLSHF